MATFQKKRQPRFHFAWRPEIPLANPVPKFFQAGRVPLALEDWGLASSLCLLTLRGVGPGHQSKETMHVAGKRERELRGAADCTRQSTIQGHRPGMGMATVKDQLRVTVSILPSWLVPLSNPCLGARHEGNGGVCPGI